jgi:tetratricopeptide (TPR) repeat protein
MLKPPQEITHVPVWVKGILAISVFLFAVQIPDFPDSLRDAVRKSRATKAYYDGQYTRAIEHYKHLHARYPKDNDIVKNLGFSYYRAGLYVEAIETFNLLAGVKMPKDEVVRINLAVSDMAAKMNHKTK